MTEPNPYGDPSEDEERDARLAAEDKDPNAERANAYLMWALAATGVALTLVPILFNLAALFCLWRYRRLRTKAGLPLEKRYTAAVWVNIGWMLFLTILIGGTVWIGVEILDPRGSLHEYKDYFPDMLNPEKTGRQ